MISLDFFNKLYNIRNQRIFFIVGSFFLLLIGIIFILTSSSTYIEEQNCEQTIFNTVNNLEEKNKQFIVNVNNDLEIISNYKNLKCFGKVNFIDNSYEVLQINVSVNKNIENLIILTLFLLFLISRRQVKLKKYFIFSALIILVTFFYFKLSILFLIFLLIFIFLTFLFDNHKYINIFLMFLIYFNQNRLQKIELSSNETGYIGRIFKSENYFSSYIEELPTFAITFEKFVQIFINIFDVNFYIILNLIFGFIFCIYIYKILEFYNISSIFTIFFLIIFHRNQSLLGNTSFYEGGLEPNTLGNVFFLMSVYYLLKNKKYISILLYCFTVYFHLALAIVLLPLYLYLYKRYIEKFILFDFKPALLSIFLSLPLFWFVLFNNNLFNSTNSRIVNKFIIKERIPHHVYPFIGSESRVSLINPEFGWRDGYIKLFVIFGVIVVLNYFFKSYMTNSLFFIVRFVFIIVLIYSTIVFFFPYSNFVILTPFKVTTYFVLFSLLYFFSLISNYLYSVKFDLSGFGNLLYLGLSFYLLFTVTFTLDQNIKLNNDKLTFDPSFIDIAEDIDNLNLLQFLNNSRSEVLLIPNKAIYYKDFLWSLELYSDIPTYVNYKNSPIYKDDFLIWKNRLLKKEKFFSGHCDVIDGVSVIYYLVINNDDTKPNCGSEVFTNKTYSLFLYNNY